MRGKPVLMEVGIYLNLSEWCDQVSFCWNIDESMDDFEEHDESIFPQSRFKCFPFPMVQHYCQTTRIVISVRHIPLNWPQTDTSTGGKIDSKERSIHLAL